MARANLKLEFLERNDHVVDMTVTDDTTGGPLDLTGLTVEMALKPSVDDPYAEATVLSTETGEIAATDEANGKVSVQISSTAITAKAKKNHTWTLDVVDATTRRTAIWGTYTVVNT